MKIIDKYTLKQIIIGFVLVLTSMTVLVWLTQSLRMIDMIVTKGVSIGVFLELTILVLPNFLQVLSPLALFAVTLFTLIRMQSDKELMVMQAVGMSPKDIMRPVFKMAAVLTVFGYLFSVFIIPMSNTELREMKWKIRNDLSHLLLQEGQFNSVGNGLTLYVKERAPDGTVKGILAYDAKDPKQVSILSANYGIVFQEPDGIRVEFHDGSRQEYQPGTDQFSILKFEKYTMSFADKGKNGTRTSDVRELSLQELLMKSKVDVGGRAPLWRKHKVEFVKRLVQPLYNITFMFLVMFGILSGHYNRRGQSGRIYATVGAALLIQSCALMFENMAGNNLFWLIFVILNVFSPLLFLLRPHIKKKRKDVFRFGILCLMFVMSGAVSGQAADLKFAKMDTKAPVDFEADKISYQQKQNILVASGNVVLKQGPMTVRTEQITFDKTQNQITAPNKITIIMLDGSKAHTENGVMSGDLSTMLTGKTDIRMYEGSYLGAEKMERMANGDSYLTEAVYTPCDVCENVSPLWQLRSKTVWNDTERHDLVYKNAFLDVKDVPVFYLPYWRMPDFSVKRRSGFLNPSISSTHEIRHGVSTPYFINVADNQNLTITPIIAPEHFPMGLLDYQGRFSSGMLSVQASGTKDRGDNRKEGHIDASFRYDMTEHWMASGRLYKTATDTYFRRYQLPGIDDSEPFLTSHLTAERFGNRNYFRAKFYSFQSLQDGVSSHSIPVILPVIDYQYNTQPLGNTGIYGFSAVNAMMFNTRDHFKSNRISVMQGVKMPYITSWGLATETTGFIRSDGYAVDTGKYAFGGRRTNETYNTGRIYPNVSARFSYPLVQNQRDTTQILEPIVQLVAAPNGGNREKIPNVDSLVFDFDDTDLFSVNRFSGYDRVEPGTRLNYGIKWSRFNHKTGRSVSALFGQSYRFDDDEMMTGLMGYGPHFSNYVGRVQVNIPYFSFLYRTRLDQKTLQAQKNEIGINVGSAPLRLGLSYVMRKAYTIGDNQYDGREEIVYTASSQLTRNFTVSGFYRYDLSGKGEPVKAGGAVRYDNECTALVFEVDKSYTQDRDYKGSISFMAKVILKTLGGM